MASKIDQLPKAKRDAIVRDIVLGRRSMFAVARDLKIADPTVSRYMQEVTEEERLSIVADSIAESKLKGASRRPRDCTRTRLTCPQPTSAPTRAGNIA